MGLILKPRIGLRPRWNNNPMAIPAPAFCCLFNRGPSVAYFHNYAGWQPTTTVNGSPEYSVTEQGTAVKFISGDSDSLAFDFPVIDYVTTPNTMICLFKTGATGTARPFSFSEMGIHDDYYFALDANIGNDFSYWFRLEGTQSIVYAGETPSANTIYMMAGVAKAAQDHELYVDGVYKANNVADSSLPSGLITVGIGALVRPTPVYSDCEVIASWLYDCALSAAQLAYIYQHPYYAWEYPELWEYYAAAAAEGPTMPVFDYYYNQARL